MLHLTLCTGDLAAGAAGAGAAAAAAASAAGCAFPSEAHPL